MSEKVYHIKKNDFKPGFWFFQVFGWIGFAITDVLINKSYYLSSIESSLTWLTAISIGFILTLGLRLIYKYIYRNHPGLLSVALLTIAGSFFGSLLWYFSRNLAFELIFNLGKVNMPFIRDVYNLLWVIFVWSILYFGLKMWVNLVDEKIRAGKADADTREAQLQMLRYQINPHFLFNTLNSIKALIRRETYTAENMITEFSEFLRYTIRNNDKTFISLEEEIEIVKKYLLLEKIRFEKRLDYKFENSEESLKVPVLCFLLQPFVENAIKHGLQTSPSGIELSVRSFISNKKMLILEIENTGKWVPESDESGIGLKNVKDRLDNAYPGTHGFSIDKGENRVLVKISIPLHK
ncbi:MAG: histidine kinase [Bacteroidota bacterium]